MGAGEHAVSRSKGTPALWPGLGDPALGERLGQTEPVLACALDPKNLPKPGSTWQGMCHAVKLLPDERPFHPHSWHDSWVPITVPSGMLLGILGRWGPELALLKVLEFAFFC